MNWFWVSVACSAINFVYFKAFERWGIQTFQAVAANYVICVFLGLWLLQDGQSLNFSTNWLPYATVIGAFYIFIFWLIGRSTQLVGVAPTAIAAKLSMVIPVTAAYLLYNDPFTYTALVALLLGIVAIGLSVRKKSRETASNPNWRLPLIIFVSAGIADLLLKHTEISFLQVGEHALFLVVLFGSSGLIGWIALLIPWLRGNLILSWRSLAAGVLLGLTNFFSVYGILHALKFFKASTLFPMNNLAIILVSAVLAAILFRERLQKQQYWGLGLAILAIVLLLWL